jgi:hypothetical protein
MKQMTNDGHRRTGDAKRDQARDAYEKLFRARLEKLNREPLTNGALFLAIATIVEVINRYARFQMSGEPLGEPGMSDLDWTPPMAELEMIVHNYLANDEEFQNVYAKYDEQRRSALQRDRGRSLERISQTAGAPNP